MAGALGEPSPPIPGQGFPPMAEVMCLLSDVLSNDHKKSEFLQLINFRHQLASLGFHLLTFNRSRLHGPLPD